MHQDEHGHQRHRNRHRRHQRGTHVAEEENQHDADQTNAFHHRVQHFFLGRLDQVVAIDIRHDAHALRGQPLVEFGDLGVDAFEHMRGVFVLQQIDDALDGVGVAVLAQDAFAHLMAVLQLAQVAHEYRYAVGLRHHDGAQILQRMHHADAAHDVRLLAARDATAARVGRVGRNRAADLIDADLVAQQLGWIELQLKLLCEAAEHVDIGHARHLLQRRHDGPVLQLGQLHQILRIRLQRIAVDLARGARDRIEAGRDARRQGHLRQPLGDALALPVILGAVLEGHGDQRQAEGAA